MQGILSIKDGLVIERKDNYLEKMEMLDQLVIEFGELVRQASPATCQMFRYSQLFGTTEQNMRLLAQNSNGKHFEVRSHNGTTIDCMFFPFTEEDPLICARPVGKYADAPTMILCNPNAMSYQNMIAMPNS